jgi:glyoxylase-like metal-dependent hydrolase (beta-lactamase superfamily II)
MQVTRRRFFGMTAAGSVAVAATQAGCAAPVRQAQSAVSTGWTEQQAPGFYRLRLGDFRVTVLSDGTAPRDLPNIMSKPTEVRQALDAAHETLPVQLSINCFLIDTGSKKIMVDTGAGELFGSTSGKLVDNMRAAGYRTEDIDTILLTHIHGDHSGGLTVGGERIFPNAEVHVDKRDPDYWLDPAAAAAAGPDQRTTFAQSYQTVHPYLDSGQLRTFDGPTELFPGVGTMPEHGHTPGLTGYMVESRGERMLLWGDIVHAAEVQFKDPTVTVHYDVDPEEAATSRLRVLNDAAKQGYLVGGAHLSFPGLGHVHAEQTGFSWTPSPYNAQP